MTLTDHCPSITHLTGVKFDLSASLHCFFSDYIICILQIKQLPVLRDSSVSWEESDLTLNALTTQTFANRSGGFIRCSMLYFINASLRRQPHLSLSLHFISSAARTKCCQPEKHFFCQRVSVTASISNCIFLQYGKNLECSELLNCNFARTPPK